MRKITLAAVIGGVLASAAAGAANHDVFVGGASAQSAFFKADFGTTVCGGAANVTTYTITGVTVSNEAWRCTATAALAGIAIGDVVTVHYNSELGSISGVSPLYYNLAVAPRLFVNPDSAACSAPAGAPATSACTIATYSNQTEAATPSAPGTAEHTGGSPLLPMSDVVFVPHDDATQAINFNQFDIAALDVEIKHWGAAQNWTDATFATALGATPGSAPLVALAGATPMNGQVFSVIGNNAGPLAALGNLSKRSLSGIVKGQYNVWGDVPELPVGSAFAATPIKLCRREYGSGTQVAASMFLTGFECGYSSVAYASITNPAALTSIVENASTGAVRTCVQGAGNEGAIGVTSLSTNASWVTINIDGVQANAHNAAAGFYPFAFETVVYNRAALGGAQFSGARLGARTLAATLISNAQKAANLTSQIEATATQGANGQWTATTRRAAYGLPIGGSGNTPPAVAKVKGDISPVDGTIDRASVALVFNSGDNCKVPFNANTN